MIRRALAFAALAAILAACPGSRKKPPAPPAPTPTGGVDDEQKKRLARELEATVLENYLQMTLSNVAAVRDALARERDVVLLGVEPHEIAYGDDIGDGVDRRPYRRRHPRVYSKNLEIHLSEDGSVGWLFDEVSYRVPFLGREASIPIRTTSVYVRDIDRWALAMEHMSYAWPVEDILAAALDGTLADPDDIDDLRPPSGSTRLIVDIVSRLANGTTQVRRKLSGTPDAILLFPDPAHEFRGEGVYDAPVLAGAFSRGGVSKVELGGHRVSFSDSGRVAWVVANLSVTTTANDEPVKLGLRGSWILEIRKNGWEVVQTHISAPIRERRLSQRVFGEQLPGVGVAPPE